MRASINQTGRTKIPSEELSIELFEHNKLRFKWNFSRLQLKDDTEVILELSSLGNNERISLSPETITSPGEIMVSLDKFIEPSGVIGRFKIVTVDKNGLRFIMSESKTLRLENDKLEGEQGKSLLDIFWDPQLKVPWQLIFEDTEPVLKISNYHDNASKIYTHIVFQTSILSEVLGQIAFWLLTEDPDESQNIKVKHWWELMEDLGLSQEDRTYFTGIINKDLEVITEIMAKCQEFSDRFAVKHNILQRLTNFITEEGE